MSLADCDYCGDPIDGPIHDPHDRDCPQSGDCDCDNQLCEGCCWTCALEAATDG